MKLFEILGVEIFSVGTHKGDDYTVQDLDTMVQAFGQLGFTPPLKDGHCMDTPGMPSLGWLKNLRRIGNKLIADFMDVPEIVYDAIKSRRYDRVSAEIYHNYKKQDGTIVSRAVKALSLLGADIPAVKDLRPLREIVHEDEGQEFKVYDLEFQFTKNDSKQSEVKVKNDEVIKQEEVKKMDIEARMKELEDKFTKVVASKDSEITDLQGKLTTLSVELEKAKTESAKFSDTDAGKKVHQLQKQLEDTTVQLEQTMQKFAEAEKKKFTLEEVQRKERIERKVKDLKFPALRPYIEVFYEEATKGESESKVVKFSADGSAPKELTVERVVDGFVSTLNRLAENKMFSELSTMPEFKRDDVPTSDDPAVEVDKRVREYCAKHNLDVIKSYGDAQTKVFLEDPKLKEIYAQS